MKSVIIKYDETKQKSRCFGFIEFDNEDSMQGVIRDKDDPGHTIDGKKVCVCVCVCVVGWLGYLLFTKYL